MTKSASEGDELMIPDAGVECKTIEGSEVEIKGAKDGMDVISGTVGSSVA
jgi:hypothetical protein